MFKRWWYQLGCAHYWVRALALSLAEIELSRSGFDIWECNQCGKRQRRRAGDPPVSRVTR